VVIGPSPEDALLAVRHAEEALTAVAGRRDELLGSLAEAERRLADLRQQAQEATDFSDFRFALEQADGQLEAVRRQAAGVRRESIEASEVFGEVSRLMAAARADADAVRRVVTAA
jgi:hypothetical protein